MAATMKPEINRSQSIRDYFKKNPKALAKEVVAALGAEGITVSEGHVYVVKGKMKLTQKRKAKAKVAATASANGTPASSPKKAASAGAPNKSAAIRKVFKQNPKAKVDDVISILAAEGIDVKKGLVYLVKGKMRSRKRRRQAKEKIVQETVPTASSKSGSADALTTIKQIKSLAAELGGMKKLKALVEALSD